MKHDYKLSELSGKVGEFHKAFEVEEYKSFYDVPEATLKLRGDLIKEEALELIEALKNRDKVETYDALGDLLYLIAGSLRVFGFEEETFGDVFNEIQLSNMSKLDFDGKPIFREDGKVLKGESYFPPRISSAISREIKRKINKSK